MMLPSTDRSTSSVATLLLFGCCPLHHRSLRPSRSTVVRSFNIRDYARVRGSRGSEDLVFSCRNSGFQTRFQIRIDSDLKRVTITSQPQWSMPESKRAQALIYVTLLNYKLLIGSVDVDLRDGEVQFKTSAPFENASNIRSVLETFLGIHVDDGKGYLQGFAAIKDNNADAEDAMRIAGVPESGGGSSNAGGGNDDTADLLLQLSLSRSSSDGSGH